MLLLVSWAADNRPVFFFKDVFHSSRRTPEEGCRCWIRVSLQSFDHMSLAPLAKVALGCASCMIFQFVMAHHWEI